MITSLLSTSIKKSDSLLKNLHPLSQLKSIGKKITNIIRIIPHNFQSMREAGNYISSQPKEMIQNLGCRFFEFIKIFPEISFLCDGWEINSDLVARAFPFDDNFQDAEPIQPPQYYLYLPQ